jgi:hypothetical protein
MPVDIPEPQQEDPASPEPTSKQDEEKYWDDYR